MFTRLRTKLTVLYAGLFGVALLLVAGAVYLAVSSNAERLVRGELAASGTVFDRLRALRAQELQDNASVLSRDFGFRAAVATGDEATIRSALQNLSARVGIDLALIVGVDGRITTADGRSLGPTGEKLHQALDSEDNAQGVFVLDGAPYQAVSAPILSPALTGWVVFAARLDRKEMTALERLSAIPLDAEVLDRRSDQVWRPATGSPVTDQATVGRFIDQMLAAHVSEPRDLEIDGAPAVALVKPLHPMAPGAPVVLLLQYPLAKALAPYQPLVEAILLTGAVGALLLLGGAWAVARGVTQPISALDDAAHRLQMGEDASVVVSSRDEIGRLAQRFNAMAGEIHDREEKMRRDAQTLAVALDRAEGSNRMMNQFLANMSHELRTPLNGILGMAQVLNCLKRDPAEHKMIGVILDSAGALEQVLTDLLDAARLQSGEVEIALEPFALAPLLKTLVATWSARAAARGLSFRADLAGAANANVVGDPARLTQILDNLLSNAVKFTHDGGVSLTVTASGTGERARLRFEVRDTGIGFDPELKERLFSPFEQADGSATRKYSGSGLGLAVSRGLAQLMGGTLDALSRPGEGSTFWLDLPLAAASVQPSDQPLALSA